MTDVQDMGDGVIVVTGAASGMGRAAARRLVRPSGTMVLVDIDEDRLAAVRDELLVHCGDANVDTACVDVFDDEAVAGLIEQVRSHGPLSILAHAAGISPTMSNWRRVLGVNLVGTAVVLDAFLPLSVSGSVAVCWSSGAAYMAPVSRGDSAIDAALDDPRSPDLYDRLALASDTFDGPYAASAAYGWSKRGVIRLTQRLAPIWGKHGARLLTVSPGIVDTPMARFEYTERSYMQELIESSPIPRMGTADEVAELVAFLTSPAAAFITGADFLIDGGCASMLAARA